MIGYDVAVIGGGIIGVSAAALLAEAGRSVVLLEKAELAAGASGRNSGAIQHPFDPPLADLHRESLLLYRELAAADDGFRLAAAAAGLLLISPDMAAVVDAAGAIRIRAPDLIAEVLGVGEARRVEPALAGDLAACRLATGYPVAPAAATGAYARRARRAGVIIRTGTHAAPILADGRVEGVALQSGERVACGQVLIAAGPWSAALVPGWADRPPIRPVWGVVVGTSLAQPPGHLLEELGIDQPGHPPEALFSLVTAEDISSIGSTFLPRQPDPQSEAAAILQRARKFVPGLANAAAESVRVCARPVSVDGRPLIGAVPHVDGLFVCAGHGPWGISTGPASAMLISRLLLGLGVERAEFSPARLAARYD